METITFSQWATEVLRDGWYIWAIAPFCFTLAFIWRHR